MYFIYLVGLILCFVAVSLDVLFYVFFAGWTEGEAGAGEAF